MKPFFNKPQFVTVSAYILTVCMVIITLLGVWQFGKFMSSAAGSAGYDVVIMMLIAHTIVPALVFAASFLLIKRRRAERAIVGAVLVGVHTGVSGALFFLPISIEPLVALSGDGSHRWLQFWSSFVAILAVVALYLGVVKYSKKRTWQLSPYITFLITTTAMFAVTASAQITTLYNNEGSRMNLGSYSDVLMLGALLVVIGILAVRRKAADVVHWTIILQVVLLVVAVVSTIPVVMSPTTLQ